MEKNIYFLKSGDRDYETDSLKIELSGGDNFGRNSSGMGFGLGGFFIMLRLVSIAQAIEKFIP